MALDPRSQECLSRFGYGTGFFAEEASRGIFGYIGRGFCECCPVALECRRLYSEKVVVNHEDETAAYNQALKLASKIGVHPQEITQGMARAGNVDPYTKRIFENVQEGAEDREPDQ